MEIICFHLLYGKCKSEEEAIEFCKHNNIEVVNLTKHQYDVYGLTHWTDNNINVCVFTVNDYEEAKTLYDAGVKAIFTDVLK